MRSILIFAAMFAQICSAQSALLTLDSCLRLAESAPSQVTIARLETQMARAGVAAARSQFFPQATLNSGYTYNSSVSTQQQAFIALNGLREYQAIAAASVEIDTSGRMRAALARAKADQSISDASFTIARRDLRRAVAAAYFRTLLARHLLDAAEASLMEAASFRQRTQSLFQGGEVARADVVKAESQVAFLQQARNAADLEAQLANQDLASFWTADVTTRLQLEDTLIQPSAPERQTEPDPWFRRPEFQLLTAEERGFQADIRRERAGLFPQLGLVYQYGIDATRLAFSERGSATFLTLNIPIFDFFRIRNTTRQFQLRLQQMETNRAATARVASRDYQAASARLRLLWEQIEMTKAQVSTSEENLKLSRTRYEGGEGPALDVVAAQQQLQQARVNYYTALAGYANARTDLEVSTGR